MNLPIDASIIHEYHAYLPDVPVGCYMLSAKHQSNKRSFFEGSVCLPFGERFYSQSYNEQTYCVSRRYYKR